MATPQAELPFGFFLEQKCSDILKKFNDNSEKHFQWLAEILAEAKGTFKS